MEIALSEFSPLHGRDVEDVERLIPDHLEFCMSTRSPRVVTIDSDWFIKIMSLEGMSHYNFQDRLKSINRLLSAMRPKETVFMEELNERLLKQLANEFILYDEDRVKHGCVSFNEMFRHELGVEKATHTKIRFVHQV